MHVVGRKTRLKVNEFAETLIQEVLCLCDSDNAEVLIVVAVHVDLDCVTILHVVLKILKEILSVWCLAVLLSQGIQGVHSIAQKRLLRRGFVDVGVEVEKTDCREKVSTR